jgi:hypothetical protein
MKVLLAAGLFLILLILFIVPPANLPLPVCAFHSITGHSCLTCGMTRSLHAILHGDLSASLRYHLLGPGVFVGMILCLVIFAAEAISGNHFSFNLSGTVKKQAVTLLAIVWFVYWGARLFTE